jgi:hypothetical protein
MVYMLPDISEELTAFLNRVMIKAVRTSENDQHLPDYLLQHPRRQPSSHSSMREPQISTKNQIGCLRFRPSFKLGYLLN